MMHEHKALIILLKNDFTNDQFAWNYDEAILLFKTMINHQLLAEYSHVLHATDNMICPEIIKDIYYLKIECTSEAETEMLRHLISR